MKSFFGRINSKIAVMILVLAAALCAIPLSATQTAYAGGSYDYNFVTGANDDDTVYTGSKLQVAYNSLYDIFGDSFIAGYMSNEIEAFWDVGGTKVPADFDGNYFTYTVKNEDAGKEIVFFTLSVGNLNTSFNNNSSPYKVVAAPDSGSSESGDSDGSGGSGSSTPSGAAPTLKDVVLAFDSEAAGEIRMTLLNNGSDSHAV